MQSARTFYFPAQWTRAVNLAVTWTRMILQLSVFLLTISCVFVYSYDPTDPEIKTVIPPKGKIFKWGQSVPSQCERFESTWNLNLKNKQNFKENTMFCSQTKFFIYRHLYKEPSHVYFEFKCVFNQLLDVCRSIWSILSQRRWIGLSESCPLSWKFLQTPKPSPGWCPKRGCLWL